MEKELIILKKILIALSLLLILSVPTNAFALSCITPPEPLEAYEKYDAVLIGTVKNIKDSKPLKKITLEVKDTFKGDFGEELVILEDFVWGESKEGQTYLYYLNEGAKSYENPLCSPTTNNLEEANAFVGIKSEKAEVTAISTAISTSIKEEQEKLKEKADEKKEPVEEDEELTPVYLSGFILGAGLIFFVFGGILYSWKKEKSSKKE